MVAFLREHWNGKMPLPQLIELRDHLDGMLHSIRSDRAIVPAVITCSKCGSTGHGSAERVSVRAMILSLARFGIASTEDVKAIEKAWDQYRRNEQLDLYGRKIDA
jgi:hypothetical protein